MTRNVMAFLSTVVLGALLAGCQGESKKSDTMMSPTDLSARETALVEEWKALSQDILKSHPNETPAQNQKEIQIVGDLLGVYKMQAENAYAGAKAAKGDAQAAEIRSAMDAVTKLAMEGDKRVNDIKMTLQKGGHHYSKAEGSEEEFIFINPKAKKALMDEVAKMRTWLAAGKPASAADLDASAANVWAAYEGAMKKKT
jgi:outer membrane murein-binding lipoprotein Lpp